MNQNTLRCKLFPFSLADEVKVWYNWKVGRVGGDWIILKDEFCLFFFPVTKMMPLHIQLFTFKQGEESLGVAWARFMQMATSIPPHMWQNHMNYSGSSAQTITIQTIGSQRTSNGTTH
jgi:hypothetical protein